MSPKRHNKHTMTESKTGNLMALHSSFWLPVAFAALFLLFDLYHVHTQMDYSGKPLDVVSRYGFELLRAINNYFPSTLLPFAVFAILQQGVYHVSAGIPQWKLGHLMFRSLAYSALYAIYIAQGGTENLLFMIMAVATVVFGFSIWLSLGEEVHKAPANWRRAIGNG